jgi:hypothetical protein
MGQLFLAGDSCRDIFYRDMLRRIYYPGLDTHVAYWPGLAKQYHALRPFVLSQTQWLIFTVIYTASDQCAFARATDGIAATIGEIYTGMHRRL